MMLTQRGRGSTFAGRHTPAEAYAIYILQPATEGQC